MPAQVAHSGLGKPMLLIAGGNSCVTGTCRPESADERSSLATARALLSAGTGPAWCYQLDGAGHFDFSGYGAYYQKGRK